MRVSMDNRRMVSGCSKWVTKVLDEGDEEEFSC
jgi:hypothetical protein